VSATSGIGLPKNDEVVMFLTFSACREYNDLPSYVDVGFCRIL
jgi:hypothetical protein